ncbi:Uncharacterised protein [Streptococcus pneumoniae]|nr:Uncharacterised protein [Streptococcus pneumoniae]
MSASVTVSIPALINGMFSCKLSDKTVLTLTSLGNISDLAGTSNTSSKVKPSLTNLDSHIIVPPMIPEIIISSLSIG